MLPPLRPNVSWLLLLLAPFCSVFLSPHNAGSRERSQDPLAGVRFHRPLDGREIERARALEGLFSTTSVDTFLLGDWDFDGLHGCTDEGWTSRDVTAQREIYWHVTEDTAAVCLPTQVMWCGQEPAAEIPYCQWSDAPGYGNDWKQYLCTEPFPIAGTIEWKFRIAWDTEPGFDFLRLQYDSSGTWTDRLVLDGKSGDSLSCLEERTVPITPVGVTRTKLRFCFESEDAFSDEDGLYASDWGAVSVDNIVVTENSDTLVPFEDFEDETAGLRGVGDSYATENGDTTWFGHVEPGVGDFVGYDNGLFEEDPCRDNSTCQLHFINGSTETDPNFPGVFVTPRDIDNEVVSPKIDWDQGGTIPAGASNVVYEFEVYQDLPLGGSVFFLWGIRSYTSATPDCPGEWKDRNGLFYGPDKDFLLQVENVSDLIEPDVDAVQVRLWVRDLCDPFCISFGFPGYPHTPSPTFDNVRLYRTLNNGPAWAFRSMDLFQDNFPDDGTMTGTARIDAAMDVNPRANPLNRPGDSLTVDCSAPAEGGLADHPLFYFRVVSGPDSGLTGASAQGDYGTWIGVENGWNCIRMDSSRAGWFGETGAVVDGKWAVDLNDSLFVAGDVLHYFFKATTNQGNSGFLTDSGIEDIVGEDTTGGRFFEVSILPSGNSDILYVDDFDGRGAEVYYTTAFEQAGFAGAYDKYDVLGSTSAFGIGNGPGGRVKDLAQIQGYNKILWNSGDLDVVTISDGQTDKGEDATLLRDYLKLTDHDVGLWVSGDGVGFDVNQSTQASALDLLNNWCGVVVLSGYGWSRKGQFDLTGIAAPTVHAEPGSPWYGVASCSTHVAYGGCLVINQFDVLGTNAGSSYAFTWPGHNPGGGDARGAVITNSKLNSKGKTARTIWQAYSFHYIRDDIPSVPMDRTCFLRQALMFLGNTPGLPTEAEALPQAYALSQNNPNPFNPVTKIAFSLPRSGEVSLVIYDVAGRRVRTLIDEFRKAGNYGEVWDGRNDAGRAVTSGVYFYRISTPEFTDQKKMVLLK